MSLLFLQYPKCSTCVKAKKFLEQNNIEFEARHIVEENPSKDELKKWIEMSGLPLKKFFNTSGVKYRELNMKDKVKTLTEDELLDYLSSDGMLVKRPLLISSDNVEVGFKEEKYIEFLNI